VAIGTGTSRKKAERDVCIEACVKLDKLDVLRGGALEHKQYKKRMRELYGQDEDEADEFYDRTARGIILLNLEKREKKLKPDENVVETLDSLTLKKEELLLLISDLEDQINKEEERISGIEAEEDDLDAFMNDLNRDLVKKTQAGLQSEMDNLRKVSLINTATGSY
jgi:SMC interacting uncharacterized protein involved in chromosome segregation